MGEPDLTENVRFAAEMLHGEAFPVSSFRIRRIEVQAASRPDSPESAAPDGTPSGPSGRVYEATLVGDFALKGVTVPLAVPATFVVRSADSGGSELMLQGRFTLEHVASTFDVFCPVSDDPDGDRLIFTFRFLLAPANGQQQP